MLVWLLLSLSACQPGGRSISHSQTVNDQTIISTRVRAWDDHGRFECRGSQAAGHWPECGIGRPQPSAYAWPQQEEFMAHLVLACALARWLPAGSADGELALEVSGATLGQAFEDLFSRYPGLRGYVLDELGRLRHHVAVFVDGDALPRRDALARPLVDTTRIHVLQALSGG